MNLMDVSTLSFTLAFVVYCISFGLYCVAVGGKRWSNRDAKTHEKKWTRLAFIAAIIGLAAQVTSFITRWIAVGHIPNSNLFEYITLFALFTMAAFFIIQFIYKKPLLGMFALPLTIILIGYASVFDTGVQPLIPQLQSNWLKIHVSLAALGEAFFAVSFAAALMYLLRTVNFNSKEKNAVRQQRVIEFVILSVIIVCGFIISAFTFKGLGYTATYEHEAISLNTQNQLVSKVVQVEYTMPPIFRPYNSTELHMDSFLGITSAPFETPEWFGGANAGRKLNTVIWSIIFGLLIYGIIRLIIRKPLGKFINPFLDGIDENDLDEISYRSIVIGFPIFTLGALIFAAIWAEKAWGRFWNWDPKETWALITWLYYSAYLHFRLSRGWQGKPSAWLAVVGFIIVLFTLVGVNLLVAGMHSYAGVE